MVLLFWCRLTPVLLEKRPLNERSSSSCCQNDWLSASDKTYRKENGKVKYVTHMLRDYHVRSSVSCCVKNGSYSSPNLEWKLSDWQYCWNILLSQQILDAMMKHVIEGDFIFSNTVHWHLLHSTQSNCYSAKHPYSFLSAPWPQNGPELNSDDDEI